MSHVTDGQQEHGDKNVTSNTKTRSSGWTRYPHMTRSRQIDQDSSTIKDKAAIMSLLHDSKASETLVKSSENNVVREIDPKNYSEALRSDSKD